MVLIISTCTASKWFSSLAVTDMHWVKLSQLQNLKTRLPEAYPDLCSLQWLYISEHDKHSRWWKFTHGDSHFHFLFYNRFPRTQETPSCLWQNTLATAMTLISTGSKQSPRQLCNLFYEVLVKKSNRQLSQELDNQHYERSSGFQSPDGCGEQSAGQSLFL